MACANVRPSIGNALPANLQSRCVQEEAINGAYFQACMGDKERTFEWPSVGRISIEQGPIGPSNTGETLWNAAVLLADHMATELGAEYFKGKRVIELGTGTGVGSIAAAKNGAARVLATDRDAKVLELAESNARANGVPVWIPPEVRDRCLRIIDAFA